MNTLIHRHVRSEFRLLEASELVSRPVAVLLGVSADAVALLGNLNIETVFDLASSVIFSAARRIADAADDPNADMALVGVAPLDMVDVAARTMPVRELHIAPLSRLRGVSDQTAAGIATAMSITTIRDAAFWPPYVAARQILNVSLGGTEEGVGDELPTELVPRMGRYPTERLQYHILLLDKVLEPGPALDHIGMGRFALLDGVVRSAAPAQKGTPLELAGALDLLTAISADAGFQNPARGALVTFTQSWYTLGLSLGHLLHALALAPGESTRIAVVDWSRRSSASTSESIAEADLLESSLDRGRAISEVARAVAAEMQFGQSVSEAGGWGFGVGLGGGAAAGAESGSNKGAATGGVSVGFGAGHSSSSSWSSSAGLRNIGAEASQKIVDATHQASSMVRSRRATAIREISQSEHETLSTRSVTNFNHMHAMTVQYYEIVQVYRTVNELARVESCLFIPMRPIDFASRAIVARFRSVLARAALNSQVRASLLSTPNAVVLVPARRSQPWNQGNLNNLNTMFNMTVGLPDDDEITLPRNLQPWGLMFGISGDNTNTQEFPFDSVVIEFDGASTMTAPIRELGANEASDLGRKYIDFRLLLGTGEGAKDFYGIRTISLKRKPGKEAFAGEIFVTAGIYLYGTTGGATQGVGSLPLLLRVEANEAQVRVYTILRTISDQALVRHLADNSLYYSQFIWRSLDAPTLGLLLSPYTLQGRPLIEMLDPTPLAVAGNYLVFRTYAEDESWQKFVEDKGLKAGVVRESLVPLPSGGVFAEAVLGRANSAERLDITRFWNWQDSPIPIQAPEIAALQAGSRAQTEGLMPGQLGTPTVTIVNPANLPEPQGMSAVLAAIQNGNMFRDMSGLGATIGLAQAAMTRAFDAARDAAAQAGDNAKTAADVLKAMYAKGSASDSSGSVSGSEQPGGGSQLPSTPSNVGALVNHGKDLDRRESSGGDPASEWAQWPGDQGSGNGGLSPPPVVTTDNERAATYGTTPPPRTSSSKGKPTPVRLYVEGRVTRDGRATQEPVSGVLTMLLSRQTAANQQDAPIEVAFDLMQGVGSNMPSLVRDEEYLLRPKIIMTTDAIANRLDEALAAARFEVPGLNINTLVSEVRNRLTTPHAVLGTGRTIIVPSAVKSMTLQLLANVETMPDFTSEVTLNGDLGFTGSAGAKATFDSTKLGDFAGAIAKLIKDPENKTIAMGIAGILTLFTLNLEYNAQERLSGDVKVGTKLVFRPQLLRSIELQNKT